MSETCCNKKCFFSVVSYFMACSTIALACIFPIELGLLSILLGVILLVGLVEKWGKLVLSFVIAKGIWIVLSVVGLIIGWIHTKDDNFLVDKFIYFVSIITSTILLGIVYLHYKDMKKVSKCDVTYVEKELGGKILQC